MGGRVVGLVVALAGCRSPAAPPAHPAGPPAPSAPAVAPVVHSDSPPLASPAAPRFVTPANPDVPPQPPVITRVKGRAARTDLGGGWRATLEPAEITAAPGDELEFFLDLRNARPGSGRPELHATARGLRWPDLRQSDREDPAQWLPLQGGRARGVVLASPPEWSHGADILLEFRQRQRPGSLGHARTNGPRLSLDGATIVPVEVRRISSRCDLPDGLAVTVEGRQITATFTKPADDIRPLGAFVVRRISGRLTLVGFVDVYSSDIYVARPKDGGCPHLRDNAFTAGRSLTAVVAQFTAPEPGPVDVVIYASDAGARDPRHATGVLVE